MYNQLKVEFYKLRTSRFLYLSIIGFLTASIMIYFANVIRDSLEITGHRAFLGSISDTSLLFIMSLFVSYFIGNDFANRTIDNEVRIGYSRMSVVISRTVVILPFTVLLYLLFYTAPCVLIMGINNGFGGEMGIQDIIIRIVLFALQLTAVLSFTVLIMFWCKKSSLGMMISVLFVVVTCNILRNYLMDNAVFQATVFYRIMMNSGYMTLQEMQFSFVSAIATIMVVLFAMYIVFRKTDLK